ncbi:MAG: hypothetical protein V4801_39985, partial [Burkholderia gladioli]
MDMAPFDDITHHAGADPADSRAGDAPRRGRHPATHPLPRIEPADMRRRCASKPESIMRRFCCIAYRRTRGLITARRKRR